MFVAGFNFVTGATLAQMHTKAIGENSNVCESCATEADVPEVSTSKSKRAVKAATVAVKAVTVLMSLSKSRRMAGICPMTPCC